MRTPAFLVLALAVLTTATSPARAADPIHIAGSDLLAESLGPDLADFARASGLDLRPSLRGSRPGLEALKRGEADLGLLLFAADEPLPGPEFRQAVIAYLTSVVVVPADLSLTQIDYAQLGGSFGANETQSFRRWNELGAEGAWGTRSISAMALRGPGDLSLELVRHTVLKDPELKPTVTLLDAPGQIYERLLGEEGGIAILPAPPPPELALKVLLLARGPGEVAYPPSPENLHTGDYPLRLPLYLVYRPENAPRLTPLLRHLLSDASLPTWRAAGLSPLPVQARKQLLLELEPK
jgi:phosphate transport system substrate-binding protein